MPSEVVCVVQVSIVKASNTEKDKKKIAARRQVVLQDQMPCLIFRRPSSSDGQFGHDRHAW